MLKSYLIVAVRNLTRQKMYSTINIFGLAIGIALCILTFLYVRHEWTYDAFHEHASSISSCCFRGISPGLWRLPA